MGGLNSRQRRARRRIKEMMELVAWLTAGRIETTEAGAPYVVCGTPGTPNSASICWFESTKTFRLFAPCDESGRQLKLTLQDAKNAAACAKRIVDVGVVGYLRELADDSAKKNPPFR